jgi:hypothetical protein
MNIPARFAIAMTDELQMIQRNELIWHKPACMPSSATDRWTVDFEPVYFFAKSPKYKFNQQRELTAASSVERLLQPNYEQQIGSDRANGGAKTNGNMKAVGRINRTAENGNGSGELGNDVRFGDAVDGYRNARTVMRIPFEPSGEVARTVRWDRVALGDASGDTIHIPFPDCRAYGGLFDLVSSVLCDGRLTSTTIRNLHTCKNLSLEPRDGFVPIDQLHAWNFGKQTVGSILRRYFEIAKDHNSQIRKTALFASTALFDKPCAQRTRRIECTLKSRGLFVPDPDNVENSISADDSIDSLDIQNLYRIVDSEKLKVCNVPYGLFYHKITEETGHYASYPTKLVEPMILAGTDEGDTVLDPFCGTGTTLLTALRHRRNAIGIELQPKYVEIARKRLAEVQVNLF